MKRIVFIGALFLTGCYIHIPDGIRAQMAAEHFLDTLYGPHKVVDKIGIGFITIKDYLNPSKQKLFLRDTGYYHLTENQLVVLKKKLNSILLDKECIKGTINVEGYNVNSANHITAFFIDSAFRKVFGAIQLR